MGGGYQGGVCCQKKGVLSMGRSCQGDEGDFRRKGVVKGGGGCH